MTSNFEDEFEAETGTYYFYGTTVTLIMEDYDDVLTGTVNGKKMTFRDGSTVIVFTRS
jgi:hypothetical protein